MNKEIIHYLTQAVESVCQKEHFTPVYAAADRHAALEWLAQRPLDRPTEDHPRTAYISMSSWLTDLQELNIEVWTGIASDQGAQRELMYRATIGAFRSDRTPSYVQSVWEAAANRVQRLAEYYADQRQPFEHQFVTSRVGDASHSSTRYRST